MQAHRRFWLCELGIDILRKSCFERSASGIAHRITGQAGTRAENCNFTSALRPGSSVVERGPEKAGVGGSIPSLATTLSCIAIEPAALVLWRVAHQSRSRPSERPASALYTHIARRQYRLGKRDGEPLTWSQPPSCRSICLHRLKTDGRLPAVRHGRAESVQTDARLRRSRRCLVSSG